ncbi:MAG TPA: sensor histidine kinase, partial [Lachnospiraceae bacterium]|nr:sensor histidine kinase [Lachnospiraceae bacterium]
IILANTEALELFNGESKWTVNIKSQVKRLNGLMQNLLTLSRMDEADIHLPMTEIDLADLIGRSAADFEEPARGKKIEFCREIPPLKVRGNRESLSQLFGILFDNAVKYTPEGGKIGISARREGGRVLVEQRNSIEPGSAIEDPNRLFDRFYRSDEARTQKSGGYGIGLSAAKAIAAANRADLTAYYADKETIVFAVKLMI